MLFGQQPDDVVDEHDQLDHERAELSSRLVDEVMLHAGQPLLAVRLEQAAEMRPRHPAFTRDARR